MLDANQIRTRSENLKRFWEPTRNKKFKEWYEQIQMIDTLAQKDMESFVGNSPRAAFNLIGSILKQRIPHRLPPEIVGQDQVTAAADLSRMFDVIWENITDDYRLRGRRWLDDLVDYLLATGMYAVFASMTLDGKRAVSEVWNPATVFPMWDDRMSECAHIFTPGANAVQALADRNEWALKSSPGTQTTISDYWWVEGQGRASMTHNGVLVGSDLVKPDTIHPLFKGRIPIFVAHVGGLPDMGELQGRKGLDRWKGEIGQGFNATNENVNRTTNKWWSFILQLVRDTAQPRTFERTTGPNQLVKPENWNVRGAHYKIGPQDEIGFITPPPLPMELRTTQLDLEAMEQRGGPSWAMYGAMQQRMTAYAMSQMAATTHQVSRAYHQGVIDCVTDIDNFLYMLIKDNNYKPYGIGLPSNLPDNTKLTAAYELRVAGDMVQRATTSKMLNGNFEMSDEYILAQNFPDVKNPAEELARVRASKARRDPVYAAISLIEALRWEAEELRKVRDAEGAALYEKAATRKEQEAFGEPQQQAGAPPSPPPSAPPPGIRPEVRPPREGGV